MSDPGPTDPATVCPLCAVGCRLRQGEGSRAKGVPGPANPEGRLCRKGVGAFEAGDDRLTEPRVRVDGELRTVSWETALERAVEGLEAVLDEHGPDALAFLGAPHSTNEENYLLGKLARALGTNNVDNRARLCHARAAETLAERVGWPATTNSLAEIGDADLLLVAGANPAERQPVAFNSFVRPAVTDGATLVHVDPVGNRTTRLADHHLAPRPGTDAAVFDLLSARVIGAGAVDEAFVAERTRGFDAYAESLAGLDRERAVRAAGVDPEALDRVADRVAGADRVAAFVGTGVEGGEANAPAALLHLLLATGNVGRRGTGLYVLRGLANEQGATDAGCVPDRLPGHQPVTDAEARERVAAEWGFDPPATPGKTAHELLDAFGGSVRGALAVGEDPAVSKRDPDAIRERLDALETLVVVDLHASRTSRHADVVLPAAAGVEKPGTVTNLERRVQRTRRAAAPPGEARTDFAVLRELGRRLFPGADYFDYAGVGAAFDELARVAPTHAGVAFDDIGPGGRQWPFDRDGTLYRERFDTPDGLAAFGRAQPVAAADTGDGLRLVAGGRAGEFSGDDAGRRLRIHPEDAAERGLDAGAAVVVSNGEASVGATADPDGRVRRGTVHLPAAAADPLLRVGEPTVTVAPSTPEEP